MYIKMTFTNGYCGCDEKIYRKFPNDWTNSDLEDYGTEYLYNWYGFYEPDSRFVDEDSYETNEEYEEAYADYQENCEFYYEDCTEEEYIDNDGEEV